MIELLQGFSPYYAAGILQANVVALRMRSTRIIRGIGMFETPDPKKTYEDSAGGGEFLSPPTDRLYGIEALAQGQLQKLVQPDRA